jgi:hypothetical protein
MSTTNLQLVRDVLESTDAEALDALMEDDATVFFVDWRGEDDAIPEYCETILETGTLSAETVDADNEAGFDIYINYAGKRLKVPLVIGLEDRHITICSLNEILHPDYEIRLVKDPAGSDTVAFLPLPTATWMQLENQYGAAVPKYFYKITSKPNIFTDPMPF